jgi:hypothetical protein
VKIVLLTIVWPAVLLKTSYRHAVKELWRRA